MPHVVVIGAGVSGLAAAHRLVCAGSVDVTVLEGGERVGGLIDTERVDDFVIDLGPESVVTDKPWAVQLVNEVGFADQIIGTKEHGRGALLVHEGKLVRIPDGFSLMAPTRLLPFATTPVLSVQGKARAALDLVLPRGPARDDESLGSFVERRLGREVLERLAQPLVGGIYGSDPNTLSLHATMPRFVQAEREYGSVIKGLRARARASATEQASGARYGLFINFKGGMRTLTERVAASLGDRIRLNTRVQSVVEGARGVDVITDDQTLRADAVVLAVPAKPQAKLLASIDAGIARELDAIPLGAAGIVTFAWRREHVPHALDAFGFVVPSIERRPIIASTFLSQKWDNRAPQDWVLLRVFVGGPHGAHLLTGPLQDMIDAARLELRSLLGIERAPELVRAHRWQGAMPQYVVGHLERAARVSRAMDAHPRIALAGNSLFGVGIADSTRVGFLAAERALAATHAS